MDLFDVTRGLPHVCGGKGIKPRNATAQEVRAYLEWIAARDGVEVPQGAVFGPEGIKHRGAIIVAMPGYGDTSRAVLEVLDDQGNVIRSTPIAVKPNGQMTLTKAQVQDATGLQPVRKSRQRATGDKAAAIVHVPPTAIAEPAKSAQEGENVSTVAQTPTDTATAPTAPPAQDAPMFSTYADFRRAAAPGTHWRKGVWADGAWIYHERSARTVAVVRSRDIGFVPRHVDARTAESLKDERGALAWLTHPTGGRWSSDAQGIIIHYACGTPNIRFDPVAGPLSVEPEVCEQIAQLASDAAELPAAAIVKDCLTVEGKGEPLSDPQELPAPAVVETAENSETVAPERATADRDYIEALEARIAALEAVVATLSVERVDDRALIATAVDDRTAPIRSTQPPTMRRHTPTMAKGGAWNGHALSRPPIGEVREGRGPTPYQRTLHAAPYRGTRSGPDRPAQPPGKLWARAG